MGLRVLGLLRNVSFVLLACGTLVLISGCFVWIERTDSSQWGVGSTYSGPKKTLKIEIDEGEYSELDFSIPGVSDHNTRVYANPKNQFLIEIEAWGKTEGEIDAFFAATHKQVEGSKLIAVVGGGNYLCRMHTYNGNVTLQEGVCIAGVKVYKPTDTNTDLLINGALARPYPH